MDHGHGLGIRLKRSVYFAGRRQFESCAKPQVQRPSAEGFEKNSTYMEILRKTKNKRPRRAQRRGAAAFYLDSAPLALMKIAAI